MSLHSSDHFKLSIRPIIAGLIVGVIGAVGFLSGALGSWSNKASDRFFMERKPDPSIVIVAIDDASITRIGRWPWDRAVHADLIRKLTAAGASVIGYDVNFPEPQDAKNDQALADAIRESGHVVLPIEVTLELKNGAYTYNPSSVVAPISTILGAAARSGHVNHAPDADGVIRRVPFFVHDPNGAILPVFSMEIAKLAQRAPDIDAIPHDAFGNVIINYLGPVRSFPVIAAADVLQGQFDPSKVNGKVVLVGATAPDLHDEQITPTSLGVAMSGVERHASLLDTLFTQDWLRPVPSVVSVIILLVLGLLCGLCIPLVRARWSALILAALWVAYLVGAVILFGRGWIADVVWPTIVLVFGYATVTLERRLTAERERRELKSAFSRYVSASVVDAIMKDPAKLKLGGERKFMTVLFSDIRGFTGISEGLKPERLVEILNLYLDRMTDIVFEHEGVLDKYIGDAVMAFWNAPFNQKDHALRAVKTALAMQKTLAEMNQAKAFGGENLRIGIGINTGDMVVGNIGGQKRFDYTVIGDNVNLGSRLESITREYGVGVIITDKTYQEVRTSVIARRLDKVAVKGKKEPVLIYEAMCLKADATKEQKALVKDFEAAFDAYLAREFSGVVQMCDAILAANPSDGPSKTLRERASLFITDPPPQDWAGTWVYTKK
jgi:adenylate cyclase